MANYEEFTKAYEELERWLGEPGLLPVLKREAERLVLSWEKNSGEDELKNEIVSRFGEILSVQHGSVRALTGAGLNRMNIYTVRQAVQALCLAWKENPRLFSSEELTGDNPLIVIGYDARPSSDRFALEAAAVFLAAKFRVRVTPEAVPLPYVSFCVPDSHADFGLMITGGKSPAGYSGLKFYDRTGAVFSEAESSFIRRKMADIDPFTGIEMVAVDSPEFLSVSEKSGTVLLSSLVETSKEHYLSMLERVRVSPRLGDLEAVITTMNGSSRRGMGDILEKFGIGKYHFVPEQEKPDGLFVTCPSPNPEKPEALRKALALAESLRTPDLVLALSPDGGSLGFSAKDLSPKDGKGSFVPLSGSQLAALLLDFILLAKSLPKNPVVLLSETVSPLLFQIAAHYKAEVRTVIPGTRAVSDELNVLKSEGRLGDFVFAYDGSSGFFFSPDVREKDALQGALVTLEMVAFHKHMKKGVLDRLAELSEAYGYYRDREIEFRMGDGSRDTIPEDIFDEEGVRIYVRKSRTDDKIRINLSLRKDSEEEASRAMNAAEFSVRGKVKEWFHSTKH